MFCPNCGNPDQSPESYCRRCGIFLPDLSRPVKKDATPEENLKANTVLILMTVIVSFTLAALLYIFLAFRDDTHPLIYVTAGLLIAMGAWHIQTFIRTRRLKKQWKRGSGPVPDRADREPPTIETAPLAGRLAPAADADAVPASVTENTTRQLKKNVVER